MPSKKSGKKNLLQGALKKELKGTGIMQDFIKNVKEEKSQSQLSSSETPSEPAPSKKSVHKSSGAPPKPPKNNIKLGWSGSREWWISFSAFITIILIVLGIYYFSNKPQALTFIYVSNHPVNVLAVRAHQSNPKIRPGDPVYCYYISDRGIDTNLIEIKLYKMQGMGDGYLMATSTYTVKPTWKVFETLIEKKHFSDEGRYKIVIADENKRVLSEQIIYISP